MTISALVITLSSERAPRASALAALGRDLRLDLGVLEGNRLPLVAETADAREGVALVDQLFAIPGVEFVDVVSVHFEGDSPAQEA